jgi:hypothetical protein
MTPNTNGHWAPAAPHTACTATWWMPINGHGLSVLHPGIAWRHRRAAGLWTAERLGVSHAIAGMGTTMVLTLPLSAV